MNTINSQLTRKAKLVNKKDESIFPYLINIIHYYNLMLLKGMP